MPGWEYIDNKEKKAINDLFNFKKSEIQKPIFKSGQKVIEFENKFSKFVGSKYAVCVSSGTAAIKVALIAAGIKYGDEVITQSFTFVAVVEAIIAVGAKPIITEVNETLNMCPIDLKNKITKKTKAIIPVHMLGVAAEVDKINLIAKKNKILVIDDNCESLGAKWKNQTLGNQFDMCAWSFDNGKTMTTGEGGMVTTNNKKLFELCREYRDHGHENNPKYPRGKDTHRIPGFNYRVSEIVGAIGLVQLKKMPKIINQNKKYYNIYEKILKKYPEITIRKIPTQSTALKDCIIFNFENDKISKKFLSEIIKKNIPTKNIPDALEWHFAKYWDHIFKNYGVSKKKLLNKFPISSKHLEKSIAIFIYASENIKNVKIKSRNIENILNNLLLK
tara:strand:- start:5951 stop:7117 length:1167 start_codon:yes stop_codon:yes gene_type:complete